MQINSIRDLAVVARAARLSRGFSQAELGARVGVSRQWVGQFEAGKLTVELGLVLRLLNALDLHLDVHEHDVTGEQARAGGTDLDALLGEYSER